MNTINSSDYISIFTGFATFLMAAATFYGYLKIKNQTEEIAKQREEMIKQTKMMIDQNKEMKKQREQSLMLIQKDNALEMVERYGKMTQKDLSFLIAAYENTRYAATLYQLLKRENLNFTHKELERFSTSLENKDLVYDYFDYINHSEEERLTLIKNIARHKISNSEFDQDTNPLVKELVFHNWEITPEESEMIKEDEENPTENHVEEKERIVKKVKLANELIKSFKYELQQKESNIINELEEISMYYNYDLADKNSMFDSLGLNYLVSVIMLYPSICKENKDVLNMYPNIAKLYNLWHPRLIDQINVKLEEDLNK